MAGESVPRRIFRRSSQFDLQIVSNFGKKKKNSISKESLGYHRPETPASRRANKEDGFRQMER